MRKDPTEFRERFKRWKAGEKVYDGGKPIQYIYDKVDKSDADFAKRLRDPNRKSIPDWQDPNYNATHKLSVGTDYNGNHYIYPEVQNVRGILKDYTNPKNQMRKFGDATGMISAEMRGDTIHVNSIDDGIKFTQEYKSYYPGFDKGKSLKKLDGGTEDNPWLPKGYNAPQNSEPVSAKPTTTYIGDNNQPHQTDPVYESNSFNVWDYDKPLSGTDPLASFVVENYVGGKVLSGVGNLIKRIPAVNNYLKIRQLSNAIDKSVNKTKLSSSHIPTEQITKTSNQPRLYTIDRELKGPFAHEVYKQNGLFDAMDYRQSPQYRELFNRVQQEAWDSGILDKDLNLLIESPSITKPKIVVIPKADAKKQLGDYVLARHNKRKNLIELKEGVDKSTAFHEALHWQNVGEVPLGISEKYERLYSAYDDAFNAYMDGYSKNLSFDQLEQLRKTQENARKVFEDYIRPYDQSKDFFYKKVDAVLNTNKAYLGKPYELVANGLEAGHRIGIKPFTPEPSNFDELKSIVDLAIKNESILEGLKLESSDDYRTAWKIITGNFLPSAVVGAGAYNTLNKSYNKGKSIKSRKYEK